MAIAGVVIAAQPQKAMHVVEELNKTPQVTTYGVYNDSQIVAVFESDTANGLKKLSEKILKNIDGILGIYPSYVTFEDEMEEFHEEFSSSQNA